MILSERKGGVAKWLPTPAIGGSVGDVPLNEWVGQALGSASMCWEDVGKAGVFDSTRCGEIFDELMAHLDEVINEVIRATRKAAEGPQLGLATTGQMLQELEARGAIGMLDDSMIPQRGALRMLDEVARRLQASLPPAVLDYRTVD